ncbi:alpha-ketoacid dehydrogenase subunit alpha/beta [Mesoterricola silvestris]|uniref:3-methyl-2-oxobutanoate dehydrogenase (2-methylpropanoyl-transferring) n=1 Tax=Mesoterricola silvestris TaxID=2927979 RepID=A0AA48GQM1_9BACT|nr:alpha-ketoacid dehydrogenase subunit alpha/beta [Mesoterricola silvestris]BDU73915.1 2-oxoisovalerate dehydrogenase subunit beta [Mesoterricola silvestris]
MIETKAEKAGPRAQVAEGPDAATLKGWYRTMHMGRVLDDKAPNYLKQAIGWSYHAPCAGHDGIQLALGLTFRAGQDYLFPYYRDLLTCLAGGLTPLEIILNGISKAADPSSGGRHMSNHFGKPEIHIQNVSSCTGNHTQHAVGLARAVKTYGRDAVVFSSQGESSVSEGYVYEAINGASLEKLPVVFVFQDNGYGISVPKSDQTANEHVCDNFSGFPNLLILKCDGKDPLDSMRALGEAVAFAKSGKGAAIIQADCVRIGSHSNSDKHELYRSPEELAAARAQDPLPRFRRHCLEHGVTEAELAEIEKANLETYNAASDQAITSPDPDPAAIFEHLVPEPWVTPLFPAGTHNEDGPKETMLHAINQTLKEEFRANPDTYIWGQDVANKEKGGIFNITKGMQQEFGRTRVFNGPIAEDFITGTANGFSRLDDKIRVVVEGAEFADYFWPATEQLIEISHESWRSMGKQVPNITIRLASGGYIGGGLYHSQNIEGFLTTIPGIRVVVPAFADDAAGLLRTCIRSRGVSLFLEPKFLYNAAQSKAHIPADFAVPFGKARVRREGTDLTVLAYGTPVHFALEAAHKLEAEGRSVEVVDLRSLNPLDTETIFASVKKTHRAIVVHEDKVFGGFGGEVAAQVSEQCFPWLDAPVGRVGSTFTPVGFNRILERAVLPNTEKVLAGMRKVLEF